MQRPHRTLKIAIQSAALAASLWLTSCTSSSPEVPAWIARPQTIYPPERYLVAVGVGDTLRSAEKSAAAGLAQRFESSISARETWSELTRETDESLSQRTERQTHIQIDANQTLFNLQFGESFTAPSGQIFTTAYLPRAESAQIYRQRIDENSQTILYLLQPMNASDTDPLQQYARLRKAAQTARKNERLLAQLDVIEPGARPRLPYHPGALYTQMADAAQTITVSIDLPALAAPAAREAIAQMGFRETRPALVSISGTASIEKTHLQRNHLSFVHYRYEIAARDAQRQLLFALNHAQREGHLNLEQAIARARRRLASELLDSMTREIEQWLDRAAQSH